MDLLKKFYAKNGKSEVPRDVISFVLSSINFKTEIVFTNISNISPPEWEALFRTHV
jgi:hypothetical protein